MKILKKLNKLKKRKIITVSFVGFVILTLTLILLSQNIMAFMNQIKSNFKPEVDEIVETQETDKIIPSPEVISSPTPTPIPTPLPKPKLIKPSPTPTPSPTPSPVPTTLKFGPPCIQDETEYQCQPDKETQLNQKCEEIKSMKQAESACKDKNTKSDEEKTACAKECSQKNRHIPSDEWQACINKCKGSDVSCLSEDQYLRLMKSFQNDLQAYCTKL